MIDPHKQLMSARAFNMGSDARIRGASRKANPFHHCEEGTEYFAWRDGWNDADLFWGKWAEHYRMLPLVMEGAA